MMPHKMRKKLSTMASEIMKLFTPTLALPLKKGGDVKHYVPSPLRGRARVGVQRPQARATVKTPTIKTLTSFLAALCLSLFVLQLQAETQTNQQLGKLFSKPNERSNLNVIRQNQKLKTITPTDSQQAAVITEATPIELPDPITLQGYVKRNDGAANTLWINGQAVQENSSVDHVKIGKLNQRGFSNKGASTEGVDVKIPANGKQIRLKPGQMYEPESNKVYEMQVVEKAKRLNLEQSGTIGDSDASNKSTPDSNAE